ncbi:hypothetical protein HGRIS_011498 [Hohenbuehelia grisea]|uniref:Rab-GAP TBC domain-containing protein n=1 Tax=Hohenbuehelia grisea TaxID=104357 RepID=A0ABR3JVB8_9AGAR
MTEATQTSDNLAPKTSSPDWQNLRVLSLQPGGFGAKRVELWPLILGARPLGKANTHHADTLTAEDTDRPVHPDERQIKLDTQRSFVLYPVEAKDDRDTLQSQLHELLVAVFHRRPSLSYFQGYHDIITVLFLTLPPELQLTCAEKFSLHRVRDSMGATLEPILGLLRVMRSLLRAVDPAYASILERNSPLPYYALSNLLTLFSHDMPTLPLIQHVFDYLLCRPPIYVVYLAAAIVLSRKAEVEILEEDEEGMIHSLLSGLPDIYEENDEDQDKLSESSSPQLLEDTVKSAEDESLPLDEDIKAESDSVMQPPENAGPLPEGNQTSESSLDGDPPKSDDISVQDAPVQPPAEPYHTPHLDDIPEISSDPFSDTPLDLDTHTSELNEKQIPPSHPPSPQPRLIRPRVTLSSLLAKADALFDEYPPTHPSIVLSSIMGPQSVVYTWSERKADMPSDADAELMVERPDLIVRPAIEDEDSDPGKEGDVEEEDKKSRRRRKRRRHGLFGRVDKRAVVTSAVLVLGVAVAVYGARARIPGAAGDGHGHGKDLKWLGAWVGGALVGASERFISGWTTWKS